MLKLDKKQLKSQTGAKDKIERTNVKFKMNKAEAKIYKTDAKNKVK